MSGFLALLRERHAEILALAAEHLWLVALAASLAVAFGVPAGLAMTRRPRLARVLLGAAGLAQTIPSLALFGFLIPLPLVGGIGARSAVVALVLYALLPILRNTYEGMRGVDPAVVEAARGMGMTDAQLLRLVQLPLALPVILAGVRIAVVVSVGTATIAAAIGAGGLGTYVFRGLATLDTSLILAGAVPSALLALVLDGLLALVQRSPRPGRAAAALAAAAAVVIVSGALVRGGPGTRTPVRIGSKNFTEQLVLGEMLAALLEERGFAVDRRLNLGGTQLCHEGVRSGQLDLYVEYTGTALTDVLKRQPLSDPGAVRAEVARGYRDLGLRVLTPLGFNNTFALAMTPEGSAAHGTRRISDLASWSGRVRMGMFGEFLERADGLPGLLRTYGFTLAVPPREMDFGLLYPSLLSGQVDVIVGSGTDGMIAARHLVVLEDDRHYFPPYEAVVVVRDDGLAAHPGLESALGELSGRLTAADMQTLNDAVDGRHESPARVAREFLARAGLVRPR